MTEERSKCRKLLPFIFLLSNNTFVENKQALIVEVKIRIKHLNMVFHVWYITLLYFYEV